MNNLRRLIRQLILESSNAKGINNLVPGTHKVKVTREGSMYTVSLWYEGDDWYSAHCTVTRTDNRKVLQVGAIYIDDDKADGFGPMLSDIAMELATEKNKWLAMDRSEASPSAQKLWQYYKDKRLNGDVTGMQLDTHQNFLTPEDDDNIDTRMADEQFWNTRYAYYWNEANKEGDEETANNVKRNYYTRNGLMWAFQKESTTLSWLRERPELFEEE